MSTKHLCRLAKRCIYLVIWIGALALVLSLFYHPVIHAQEQATPTLPPRDQPAPTRPAPPPGRDPTPTPLPPPPTTSPPSQPQATATPQALATVALLPESGASLPALIHPKLGEILAVALFLVGIGMWINARRHTGPPSS